MTVDVLTTNEIRDRVPLVTAIRRDRDRVTGVSTEHGDIDARNVVICGGMWTRDLAATGPSQIRRVEAGIYSYDRICA